MKSWKQWDSDLRKQFGDRLAASLLSDLQQCAVAVPARNRCWFSVYAFRVFSDLNGHNISSSSGVELFRYSAYFFWISTLNSFFFVILVGRNRCRFFCHTVSVFSDKNGHNMSVSTELFGVTPLGG